MREVLFRLDAGSKDGQETDKNKKLEEYKALLLKDGEEIIKEEQVKNRFGNCIKLTLK